MNNKKLALYAFITILLSLLILSACDDDNSGNNANNNNENEGEVDQKDDLDLSLGDTGTIVMDEYKVDMTLESVEKVDDADYDEADNGHYIKAEVSYENTGEETVPGANELFNSTELAVDGEDEGTVWQKFDDISDGWNGETEKGEEDHGPLVFDVPDSGEYELQVNFYLPSSLANKISFKFNEDELD